MSTVRVSSGPSIWPDPPLCEVIECNLLDTMPGRMNETERSRLNGGITDTFGDIQ